MGLERRLSVKSSTGMLTQPQNLRHLRPIVCPACSVLGPEPSRTVMKEITEISCTSDENRKILGRSLGVLRRMSQKDLKTQLGRDELTRTQPTESTDWDLCRFTEIRGIVGV